MTRATSPKGHHPSDSRNPNQRGGDARDRPGSRDRRDARDTGQRDGAAWFTFTDWAAI